MNQAKTANKKGQRGSANANDAHRVFTRTEEILHSVTHGIGVLLGAVGLALMLGRADGAAATVSAVVFGVSLILLYAASCGFHASCAVYGVSRPSPIRDFAEKCDHSLIFLLILGTYTPACLSAMSGTVGYLLFALVAACCVTGFVLNVVNVQRFIRVSLVLYVLSGWAIAAAVLPFYRAVGAGGVALLLLGGVSYTGGLIFYGLRKVPYFHIVWHLLVLLGSVLHFFMVYLYCL